MTDFECTVYNGDESSTVTIFERQVPTWVKNQIRQGADRIVVESTDDD